MAKIATNRLEFLLICYQIDRDENNDNLDKQNTISSTPQFYLECPKYLPQLSKLNICTKNTDSIYHKIRESHRYLKISNFTWYHYLVANYFK